MPRPPCRIVSGGLGRLSAECQWRRSLLKGVSPASKAAPESPEGDSHCWGDLMIGVASVG